jgi:hypothetical protein
VCVIIVKGYNHKTCPLGLHPKGRWATTHTTYQSIDKCHTQLSPSRSIITGQPNSVHRGVRPGKYPNHMGYTPRVVGHQPSTTYQSIDKCHTQLSPSRSIITGQPNSVHRGVRPGKYPNHLSCTSRVAGHQPSISSQVNPTQSIEEYDLENVSRS